MSGIHKPRSIGIQCRWVGAAHLGLLCFVDICFARNLSTRLVRPERSVSPPRSVRPATRPVRPVLPVRRPMRLARSARPVTPVRPVLSARTAKLARSLRPNASLPRRG